MKIYLKLGIKIIIFLFKIKHNERNDDDDDVINAKLYPFITFQQRKKLKLKLNSKILYIYNIYCRKNHILFA